MGAGIFLLRRKNMKTIGYPTSNGLGSAVLLGLNGGSSSEDYATIVANYTNCSGVTSFSGVIKSISTISNMSFSSSAFTLNPGDYLVRYTVRPVSSTTSTNCPSDEDT